MSFSYFHQEDEIAAHICTAPVFDDGGSTATVFEAGGCTDIMFGTGVVFATFDCSATANLQNPDTAN